MRGERLIIRVMRILRAPVALVAVFLFASVANAAPVALKSMPPTPTPKSFAPNPFPEVYAHRGVRAYLPENTLPGYAAALAIGTDWVDMDVVFTKDGEVLVTHDPVLNPDIVRGPDGKYIAANREALKTMNAEERAAFDRKFAVKNLTLAETRAFDVGRLNAAGGYAKFFPDQHPVDATRMPTLIEVIRSVKSRTSVNRRAPGARAVGFQIEMKTDPSSPAISADPQAFAAAVARILKEEGILDRSEIQAFDFACLRELQRIEPGARTAYLTSRDNEPGGADDFHAADAKQATLWTGGANVKDYGGSIPKMVRALGGYAWEPEDYELTEKSLAEARALGLKVVVWSWPEKLGTAFDAKLVEKMIDWRVDGIIIDDPARLSSMLAARGLRVPSRR